MLRFKQYWKRLFPRAVYRTVSAWWRRRRVREWSNLRHLTPVSRVFGLDRGQPICRYYIEAFLQHHKSDIRGRVLEVSDNYYTRKFGDSRVNRSDVLHVTHDNPQATIVGDLATDQNIPPRSI